MRIGVVLKGYPRLSETFIAQEIHGLEQHGIPLFLVSLRHPTDKATHPIHDEIAAEVLYLPEYLLHEPWRVLRAWWAVRRRPAYREAFNIWLRDLRRDITPNRVRRFGQACVLAHELPEDCGWLYAHFLHTPTSVTRYAAIMSGIPFSVSAHAKDIWTSPAWEIGEKLDAAAWTATCTAANAEYLKGLANGPEKVDLIYHGLDTDRFQDPGAKTSEDENRVRLVSVGRAVAKKGYDDLLHALASLPDSVDWTFVHIGGGPLLQKLKDQAERLGIAARITWSGARPQRDVLDAYRQADLFVLAPKITEDGDRDGLPNVMMEAQSQRLPVVSTNVSAVSELIEDGVNGRLVPPGDMEAMTEAILALATNQETRRQMGDRGREIIVRRFRHHDGIDRLAQKFRAVM